MPETKDLYYEIKKIQARIDNIDNKLALSLASNKETVSFIENLFQKYSNLAKVYIMVDGEKNVSELAKILKMSQPYITKRLKMLYDYGLIDKFIIDGGVVYNKNQNEKIFKISEKLKRFCDVT